jgi:hypothetical protein
MAYKTPAGLAKKYFAIRAQRRELDRRVAALKKQETELLAEGLPLFEEKGETSITQEGVGTLVVTTNPTATVNDWPQVFAFNAQLAKKPVGEIDSILVKQITASRVETLSFSDVFVPGLVLDHKKVLKATQKGVKRGGK